MEEQKETKELTIIPVASGKGGVGTSVITANLSVSLAEKGCRVVAVDLDLGGSNLHTCLGLDNNNPGIGDYLRAHYGNLEELLVDTSHPNLKFLAGDARSPLMANLHSTQKNKLMNQLRKLDTDYVLLDLGSGSAYNTLDFFAMSHHGLLVCTVEYTSLMNLLTFLKNLALRRIELQLPRNTFLRKSFQECLNQPLTSGVITLRKVIQTLAEIDKDVAENIQQDWLKFRPRIVFNQGRNPDDLVVIDQMRETLERNLSLRCDYFGHLFFDPKTSESLRRREPLKSFAPKSWIVEDIDILANRVIRLWKQPLRNSARLLKNNTTKIYEERYL